MLERSTVETFRFVFPYAKVYWRRYVLGLCIVPLSVAATLAIPRLTRECVRQLQTVSVSMDALFPILWALLGVGVVGGLTMFAVRWLIISGSRYVEYDLRNHLFSHLECLDQTYYNQARTGDLMSRMTSDVERVRLLAGPIIMYTSRTGLMLAGGLPLMLSISVTLTLIVMVPLSMVTITVRLLGPRVYREVFKSQETLAELSSLGQEDFSGIRVVKSFTREDEEKRRFEAVSQRYLEQSLRAARVSAWMAPIVAAVGDLALISLLVIGGGLILTGDLEFDQFVEFSAYQILLLWPMLSIGWVVNQYYRARASVDRLREVLRAEPQVREPEVPVSPPTGHVDGNLSIRGLNFYYGDHQALKDINLEAPRGSTVAIIGRTGCGKSTLVHLIPRILPVPEGTVFIDGVDVNHLPLETLRRSIGFVPQESFLFSRTVAQNIAFGSIDADEETIHVAARMARFDKDIDQFPRGYSEMVGERGVTLSGGQKQRAALARALLVQPRILILDDAFSSVDSETEQEILENLDAGTEGLTTVVIAHRVSSVSHADCIYVIDEGRLAEKGTHAELLRRGGLYAEIHHLQQISDEIDSM